MSVIRKTEVMKRASALLALGFILLFNVSATGSEYEWNRRDVLLRRYGSQLQKTDVLTVDLRAMADVLVDIRDILSFPEGITGFGSEEVAAIEKKIAPLERTNQQLRITTNNLKPSLVDGLGILREMIVSGPVRGMFAILEQGNNDHLEKMVEIAKESADIWDRIDQTIDYISKFTAVSLPPGQGAVSGVEEFLYILRSGIGQRQKAAAERLETVKDSFARRTDSSGLEQMYAVEKRKVEQYLSGEEYELAYRRLGILLQRYSAVADIRGLDSMLLRAQFATGRFADVISSLESVAADPGTLLIEIQSLYALGRYKELWEKAAALDYGSLKAEERNLALWLTLESGIALDVRSSLYSELATYVARNQPYALHVLHAFARSYLLSGDLSTARSVMENALGLRQSGETARNAVRSIRISIAELDYEAGLYDKALDQYLSLLRSEEDIDRILYGVAWCYFAKGMNTSAERTLRKLLNQSPQSFYAAEAAYLLSKRYLKRAQNEWQRVVGISREKRRLSSLLLELKERKEDREDPEELTKIQSQIARIEGLLRDIRRQGGDDYRTISSLYRTAGQIQEFVNKHYSSGIFMETAFTDKREELLHKTDSLIAAIQKGRVNKTAFDVGEANVSRRKIRDVVRRTAVLRMERQILRNRWEMDYLDWRKTVLSHQMQLALYGVSVQKEAEKTRSVYTAKIDSLITLEEQLKSGGYAALIGRIETFLSHTDLSKEDEAYLRYQLGELYYSRAIDNYFIEYEGYERDHMLYLELLARYNQGENIRRPREPLAPVLDHQLSMGQFRRVLSMGGADEITAAASYSLAWCFSDHQQPDSALYYMESVADNFPSSVYAPQAWMYTGEHHFDAGQLDKALHKYQSVLKYPESEWFDQALYKLAWTQYRMSNPDKAISSFLALLELNDGLGAAAMLERESLDYIAISFSEADITGERGFLRAVSFVEKLRDKERGSQVLHRLASVYREQGRYALSKKTYEALLEKYPDYRKSPFVEGEYLALLQRDLPVHEVADLKIDYFTKYRSDGMWAGSQDNRDLIRRADSLASSKLYDAAISLHQFALQKNAVTAYEKAMNVYDEYIRAYPQSSRANECHYNLAEILFSLGHYERAVEEYMAVSKRYPDSKYRETAAWNAIVASQNLLRQEEGAHR